MRDYPPEYDQPHAVDLRPALEKRGIPIDCWWTEDGDIVGMDDPPLPFKLEVAWDDTLDEEANIQAAVNAVAAHYPDPSTTYFNLADLLEKRGYETPWELGRELYKNTACGPWVVFYTPLADRWIGDHRVDSVYYESKQAGQSKTEQTWWDSCTGIGIGSIVEGSDVEVGPETLIFPFTEKDFDDAVQGVNDEATFYWKRDNCLYFTLWKEGGTEPEFWGQWVSFDDAPTGTWDDDPEIQEVADEVQNALWNQDANPLVTDTCRYVNHKTLTPIPGTDWFVREEETPNVAY